MEKNIKSYVFHFVEIKNLQQSLQGKFLTVACVFIYWKSKATNSSWEKKTIFIFFNHHVQQYIMTKLSKKNLHYKAARYTDRKKNNKNITVNRVLNIQISCISKSKIGTHQNNRYHLIKSEAMIVIGICCTVI